MENEKTFETCPECGVVAVMVRNGKFVRHERGFNFVPYPLYHRIEQATGTSVKEQAKKNLCVMSGKPEAYEACGRVRSTGT